MSSKQDHLSGRKRKSVPIGRTRPLTMTLTPAQVVQVMRDVSVRVQSPMLSALKDFHELKSKLLPLMEDDRYSRGALASLLVLAAFPVDGGGCKVSEIAEQLAMPQSTTHRYVITLMAAGLLEQNAESRRYSRTGRRSP
jgi:hypothetical protein